ncbi:MAG TPA: amino acid adenylation domain-containing protein, partial [Noviherbaspirillum sp.]
GALMQEIKDLKPEIVALLKQNREAPKTQAIKRIARDRDSYPVSFAQQRLWLLDQIEGGSGHYNMPGALHLKGRLDLSALEQSLDAIVLRHESLRTCFETGSDGEARQRVQPARPVGLEQIDLSMLASAAQQDRLFELFTACSTLPFDLARDLMVRAQIVKLADQEHVLLVVMHHIASDGWSMSVLIREFKALYEAFRAGKKSPLDELDVQYLDYAVWQRETLKGAALERQLDYWNDKLAGLPTVHSLPLDRPRPRSQTFSGATVTTHIGADETRLMVELCRSEDATLFMGLHAVFSALLARYSNERDIVVGSPIANREQPEIAGLIGFFVNTLVLRLDLSGTPSLRDLLAQSRQVALEAYAHQQVPFEQIVERIRPERNASHGPLFQILLALQNNEKAALDMPGFSLAEFDLPFKIAKYDLSLLVSEQDDRLELTWEYNTDLFDAATLNRLADHFGRLLQALARHPDAAVHTAELMSEAEYSRLCAWNSTAHDYCQNTPVHRLFEQRVRERPDAPAVIDGNRVLSYTELNTLANRVAHRLIDLGVALDDRVMVCMPRGLEMIVALLAALKAGAAYVVMDPEYPRDRMQYMVHDSRPAAIIATQASQNSVDGFAVPVYMLDLQMPSAGRDSNPQIAGLSSRNLGYVIYTSGSTGRPKGVLIEHRSIMRLVVNNPFAVIDAADTLAQCANPAFDASTWEIWGALTAGARLAIVPPDVLLDPERFAQAIGTYQISSMFLTTGLFNRLAEPLAAAFAQLKYLIVGGEQCDARTVSAMFQIARPEHFINGYGPTETTTFALCHEVDAAPDVSVNIPLGRPIANTTVYVLDRALQQVPLGVVGEIYIGGPGLARGYLNEPALTAERFLPDPFHPVAGGRMYRTGDLGNWRADGTIAYLGRNDFQVKIRGFRIEMGEIEHAIAACEGVREVVVAALDDQGGGKRLVAYLRARDGYHLQMDDVKRQLKASLPAHMMPAHFVEMEVFPLTANGKVDRKALPAPAVGVAAEEFVAPAGAIEIILASIWSDVLKHQGVSANDDFFQLGGHSLLATQVISKIRAALQVELSLRTLFEAPTLAALALRIEAAKMESAGLAAMPMTRVERGQRLPLSFAQQRLWFLDQLEPGSAFYNMPNPMRLIGRLDVQALCRTFDEILRRHEVLRTSFGIDQGEPVQVIKPAHKLECPIIDLSQVPDSDREKRALDLVMQDARKPFDLANGPVVRCTLVRLRETEHLVLFTMHHIVSDGWSSGVLVKEIVTLYQAFAAGSPSPLPELPLQYADFASWQRNWLQGEVLQRQLSYWKKELAGAPALLALPTDRPRPKVQAHRGANGACSIPQSTVEPLRNLAFATQSTLFMVLAAAFNVLMARLSGQSDICIGTPIANRNRNEIENLIGFFVNTLVLRTQIEPEQSFLDLLQQVRNRLLNAYMHQDIPFEQVVDALMPVRNLSHAPVFQVMLILQNAPVGALELSDLKLEPVTAELATTKFDIRLAMWEIEGRIDAYFEYDTDLFDASTIERMGRQFSCLLAAIADAPDQRLQDLPLLTGQEKQELLAHWDQMQPAFTQVSDADLELALRATNVIDLIDDITLNSPDAIALTWREHSLTYSELGRWSQRVANGLHSMGMQQGDIVGLLLDDPLMEVVATIGTLRAGGIYASFNHSYPVARLSAIIELVAPCHLITNTECIGQWSSLLEDVGSLRHVLLAAPDGEVPDLPTSAKSRKYELRQLDRQSDAAVKCNVGADDPCYIYFTSGSTGEPKAVVGRVKSLAHFVQWEIDAFRLDAATRASQLTNPSFHVYMRDVFPALCVGGTVCIPPSNAIFDPDELLRWLEHSRVSLLHCVPSLFRVLLRGCGRERLPHLKQVVVGGGAILPHDANQWFDLFGGRIELIGVYGQTETTLAKFVNRLKPVRIAEGFVPIGKPLPGAQAIVLKDNMEPCAVGEVGELFVRTPYRSLGYYRRPDLNVAAFVRNPYSRHETDILYRTGDLAMALPTGEFRYLGRKDFQVKIRGMRIELGEIEAALADCASVREAVVIAHATDADNAHLFAYLVPRELQADEHAFIAGIKRELVTVL